MQRKRELDDRIVEFVGYEGSEKNVSRLRDAPSLLRPPVPSRVMSCPQKIKTRRAASRTLEEGSDHGSNHGDNGEVGNTKRGSSVLIASGSRAFRSVIAGRGGAAGELSAGG